MTNLRWRRRKRGLEAERAALEERTSSLVGEVLASVRYVVIDPEWNASGDFDSLDFGVELILSSGRVAGLTWDDAIGEFGMNVVEGEVTVHRPPESVLDVGASSRWASLIGHEITASRVI